MVDQEAMDEEEEFENLRKDLENKSKQIKSLKAEITNQKQNEETSALSGLNLQSPPRVNNVQKMFKKVSPSDVEFPGFINSHLNGPMTENVIKNYQHHLEGLQRKLRISTEMCTEQELNYQNALKDMELKFRRILSQRDEFIKLRESESNNQQQLINHLQVALEKLEKEKSTLEELASSLNKSEDEKKIEIETLSKDIDLYKKSFKHVSVVLLPDIRNLVDNNIEDINELTVSSLSSMLEKVLLLHKNQQELRNFQIKSLENKIKDHDKVGREKLNYEKKLVEVQQQEQINNYNSIIETKDSEISTLTSQVKGLQAKLQNIQKRFKEEIIKYKANIGESKKLSEIKYNRIDEERNNLKQSLEKLKTEYETVSRYNEEIVKELETLKIDNNQNVIDLEKSSHLEQEIKELKEKLKLLEEANQQKDVQFQSSVKRFEEELKEKAEECKALQKKENDLTEEIAKVAKETETRIREEEKVNFDQKMNEVNLIIENHKRILENANLDLNHRNELINTNINKIKDLEDEVGNLQGQIHVLREKNNQQKAIVAQRDGRIIDLQLKTTELKDKLKTTENAESKRSSILYHTNQLNDDLEKKVNLCEKEKSDLRHSNDMLKQQYKTMEKEVAQLLNVLNERNTEIINMKKDRKAIAKKLKEKNDAFIAEKKKNENNLSFLKTLQQKKDKIHQVCEDLRKKNTALSDAVNFLEKDKQTMEDVLAEQEDIKDKEISTLLSRLHGSEGDILKLKAVLKRYKMSDSNGVKLASVTQRTITKQRAEVDTLKSKITWMKEALEVSEKTRSEIQNEIDDKDKQLENLHLELNEQQEANQHLSINLTTSKREAKKLHKALEQAAVKYTDVYALVEKQEECLARDMKRRQWFSGNGRQKKFFDNVDMIQSPYVSDKTEDSINNKELKSLLQDVRGLLSSTLKKRSLDSEQKQSLKHSIHEKAQEEIRNGSCSSERIIIIEPGVKRNTQKLNDYLIKHTIEERSSTISFDNLSAPINSTPKSSPPPLSPQDDNSTLVSSVYSNVEFTSDEDTLPLKVTGSFFGNEHLRKDSAKEIDEMTKKQSKKHRNAR